MTDTATTRRDLDAELMAWLRKLADSTFKPAELLELLEGTAAGRNWEASNYEAGQYFLLTGDVLGIASARIGELLESLKRKGIKL